LVRYTIALVEIVWIYGVESMMGARGMGVVVVGVRHRSVGVEAAVVEMGCRSSGMRRILEVVRVIGRHLVVEVGLG